MSEIFFTKMTGAGNDFIFIDKEKNPALKLNAESIRKLCNRRFGIGADGLIFIDDLDGYDFRMSYFNADGSTGSLCANGARCSIRFADHSKRLKNKTTSFIANTVQYSGEVINEELILFNLNEPKNILICKKLSLTSDEINYSFADTGSPHVVVNIDDISTASSDQTIRYTDIAQVPVFRLGKEIRLQNEFQPGGTNVNFINVLDNIVHIRTYERGVEDETLACGTGAVASAIIASLSYNLIPPITLKTFGGDNLIVNFKFENNKFEYLTLTGPAKIVFEGSADEKLFI